MDKPKPNRLYSLTGATNSIANGNTWAESIIKCQQCGNELDNMIAYTKYQICGKCTRKNHAKACK